MAISYGSKRTVVGAHYGLRDWLNQRITAILIFIYALILIIQLLVVKGPLDYAAWHAIFSHQWMKIFTFIVIISIIIHAWVGVRDIWMDYVPAVGLRLTLEVLTVVWLVGCAGWAFQTLWSL